MKPEDQVGKKPELLEQREQLARRVHTLLAECEGLPSDVSRRVLAVIRSGDGDGDGAASAAGGAASAHSAAGALAASDHTYRSLVEQLNVGVLMTSIDGRIVHANAAAVQMAGYGSLSELLAVPIRNLYAEAGDHDRFLEALSETGKIRGFETTCVRKDGSQYPVWLGAILLAEESGKPQWVICTHEDISYQKQAEDRLALLKKSIDTAPDGAYWFDSEGRVVYVNQAGCDALGYSHEELYTLRMSDINPRATPERIASLWQTIKAQTSLTLETEHRRKDGSLFPVAVSCAYIEVSGKEYYNGYAADLTEQKRLEKQREALQIQLLQAQKMESVGRLAGGVAHDFNNMLTVILAHVELGLIAIGHNGALSHDLLEIRGAAERAADLTGQLLAFARRQTTAPKVLDLKASVAGMMNMLRRLIGEQVEVRWQPGELWPVNIDPVQVYQILANLCINARDAINGVGTIQIEADTVQVSASSNEARFTAPGDYVRVTVRDSGSGIPADVLPHVFEPFFTTKDVGHGTGLGLSTVYGIVNQNGGSIDVQSEPAVGTTFRVYLPRYRGSLASVRPARKAARVEGGGETVLLVEDEVAILRVERNILERLGYQVLAAATPSEALRFAEDLSRPVDLLITDVVMPEMNGRELSSRLSSMRPGLQTLYVSGYPAEVIAHHGALEPGLHFLQKPFTVEGISLKVRDVLGHASQSQPAHP